MSSLLQPHENLISAGFLDLIRPADSYGVERACREMIVTLRRGSAEPASGIGVAGQRVTQSELLTEVRVAMTSGERASSWTQGVASEAAFWSCCSGRARYWATDTIGGNCLAVEPKGGYVETCSCELMCPCNLSFDHGATYDFCRVTLAFSIREGHVEGTDIAGRRVVMIADTPKVMTEGNWRVGVFIDDEATDDQFEQLVKVFSGQLGGPMAGLAPLVGEILGVERAEIEMADDGLRHRVQVGDSIEFEIEDIVPFGVETGQPVQFSGCSIRSALT